jgi:hypothetical protein
MSLPIQQPNNLDTNLNKNNTIDIFYKGVIYRVEKDDHESFDVFHQRAWFIAKAEPKCDKEFIELEIQSHIWRNMKYSGVKYDV